jgi:hypothetical protein
MKFLWLFAAVLYLQVVISLITGRVPRKWGGDAASRKENPKQFWFWIFAMAAVAAFITYSILTASKDS